MNKRKVFDVIGIVQICTDLERLEGLFLTCILEGPVLPLCPPPPTEDFLPPPHPQVKVPF